MADFPLTREPVTLERCDIELASLWLQRGQGDQPRRKYVQTRIDYWLDQRAKLMETNA